MGVNGNGTDQHVSGTVRSVNDKGLKLEGHESWLNVSKYAVGVTLPERGAHVTVTLDKAGFLRAVAPVDGSEPVPAKSYAPGASSGQNKDRTITRLAVLKAAAEFGASRPELKSGDVLTIAASWERWVNRSDGPSDDLVEAF